MTEFLQKDYIRYFYYSKHDTVGRVETDPVSVNIDDFDRSQGVLLSGGLTNLAFPHMTHVDTHSFTPPPPVALFFGGVAALISSLITQTPLRQPDRLSAAGVLGESHQQPAHAQPGSDHQEFHRWETCSEFRKSPCIHLIVMEFSSFFLLAPGMKSCFIRTGVINSGKSNL